MKKIESPTDLANRLVELFPLFAAELEDEGQLQNFHQVVMRLAPVVSGYLQSSGERVVKNFCSLVDAMADAGGEQENAISTCFLEHASQVGARKLISQYLGVQAKRELR
jgi:hypothetical protein